MVWEENARLRAFKSFPFPSPSPLPIPFLLLPYLLSPRPTPFLLTTFSKDTTENTKASEASETAKTTKTTKTAKTPALFAGTFNSFLGFDAAAIVFLCVLGVVRVSIFGIDARRIWRLGWREGREFRREDISQYG